MSNRNPPVPAYQDQHHGTWPPKVTITYQALDGAILTETFPPGEWVSLPWKADSRWPR